METEDLLGEEAAQDTDMRALEPVMNIVTEDVREEIERLDQEILKIVAELAGGSRRYAREREREREREHVR